MRRCRRHCVELTLFTCASLFRISNLDKCNVCGFTFCSCNSCFFIQIMCICVCVFTEISTRTSNLNSTLPFVFPIGWSFNSHWMELEFILYLISIPRIANVNVDALFWSFFLFAVLWSPAVALLVTCTELFICCCCWYFRFPLFSLYVRIRLSKSFSRHTHPFLVSFNCAIDFECTW